MDCKKIEEELTALVDNEAPFLRKLLLKIHLWHCTYCRNMVNIEAAVRGLVRTKATSYNASESLKNTINRSLKAIDRKESRHRSSGHPPITP